MDVGIETRNNNHKKNNMKDVHESYQRDGFYLVKGLFEKKKIQNAAHWLRSKNLKKLAKSFMDQSPGDPLAKYQSIHNGSTPVAEIAADPKMIQFASQLARDEVYIWGSLVNLKAAWYGRVDYYHQDFANYEPRGYKQATIVNCFTFLDHHNINNAALNVFPGSHKEGLLNHMSVFDINGMHKLVVSPEDLNRTHKKYGHKVINAEPGDVLFFHSLLIHGSGHNISPNPRMIILTQVNPKKDRPLNSSSKVRKFNMSRAKQEIESAKKKYEFYKSKYEKQLKNKKVIFNNPIPKEEM